MSDGNGLVIQVEHLYKSFEDRRTGEDFCVLKDVNLGIRQGERLCIVGESGCGKTVLVRHFNGMITPEEGKGRVLVYGKDLSELEEEETDEIRMKIGYVFQGNSLFSSKNVLDNVCFWLRETPQQARIYKTEHEIEERARSCLVNVGIPKEHFEKSPFELSGGMRKRVAIAREIAFKPPIIIYDEPTTGLDPGNSGKISDLIVRLHEEERNTTIVVTHDTLGAMRRINDRIIMLLDGQKYFDGSFSDFINSKDPSIRKYLDKQKIDQKENGIRITSELTS